MFFFGPFFFFAVSLEHFVAIIYRETTMNIGSSIDTEVTPELPVEHEIREAISAVLQRLPDHLKRLIF